MKYRNVFMSFADTKKLELLVAHFFKTSKTKRSTGSPSNRWCGGRCLWCDRLARLVRRGLQQRAMSMQRARRRHRHYNGARCSYLVNDTDRCIQIIDAWRSTGVLSSQLSSPRSVDAACIPPAPFTPEWHAHETCCSVRACLRNF